MNPVWPPKRSFAQCTTMKSTRVTTRPKAWLRPKSMRMRQVTCFGRVTTGWSSVKFDREMAFWRSVSVKCIVCQILNGGDTLLKSAFDTYGTGLLRGDGVPRLHMPREEHGTQRRCFKFVFPLSFFFQIFFLHASAFFLFWPALICFYL